MIALFATGAAAQNSMRSTGNPDVCQWQQGADAAAVIKACTDAITRDSDAHAKAHDLFVRAYAHTEQKNLDAALDDLNRSIELQPSEVQARVERAYTLEELYEFQKALADLDAAMQLASADDVALRARILNERALDRHWLADFNGALIDRLAQERLSPQSVPIILAVANAHLWTGAFDKARERIEAAAAMAARSHDVDDETAVQAARAAFVQWTTRSANPSAKDGCEWAKAGGDFTEQNVPKGVIGDCSRAFLDARTNEDKADLLYWRAEMWLFVAHDKENFVDDLIVTVALVPERTEARLNLGTALITNHKSRSGIDQLNLVLAKQPDNWMALAERAAGKFNLNDMQGAFADAKRSLELHPNELALTIAGDIMYSHGDADSRRRAIEMWLLAYKLGDRDDGLIQRLKDAGATLPPDTR